MFETKQKKIDDLTAQCQDIVKRYQEEKNRVILLRDENDNLKKRLDEVFDILYLLPLETMELYRKMEKLEEVNKKQLTMLAKHAIKNR